MVADERCRRAPRRSAPERALSGRVEVAGALGIPPGESSKSLAEAERVLRALAAAGMQRSDAIVALGGGVAGDLAGFCAATYQRGVAGGAGADDGRRPGRLRLRREDRASTFRRARTTSARSTSPRAVFTDLLTLTTLPDAELQAGFAEVLKTGLIAGGPLWEDVRAMPPLRAALESDIGLVTRVVYGCVRTKLDVVAADEHDNGVRASLNLGHTFAHALESATGYARFRHGEAVALGLLVALRLSERYAGLDPAVREEVDELLTRHGLPVSFDGPPTAVLVEHAGRDKKRRGDARNLVLLRAPGEVETDAEVPRRRAGARDR